MPTRYTAIFALSLLALVGCSHNQIAHELPSLGASRPLMVVQVAAQFASLDGFKRDHPYFILCEADDCFTSTPKTLLEISIPTASTKRSTTTQSRRMKQGRGSKEVKTSTPSIATPVLGDYRVYYDYSSSVIKPADLELLSRFYRSYPHNGRSIRITGYTDSTVVENGTIPNELLALDRAVAVKNFLIDLGYPRSMILLSAKALCCYLGDNKTVAGQSRNRRAEISFNYVNKGDSNESDPIAN